MPAAVPSTRPAHQAARSRGCGVAIVLALLTLPACTTVTVHAGDGSVTREHHFGVLNLQSVPGTTPVVIRSSVFGWQSGPLGHTLGWTTARVTMLPVGCHLVLIDDATVRPTGDPLLALARDPCTVNADKEGIQ